MPGQFGAVPDELAGAGGPEGAVFAQRIGGWLLLTAAVLVAAVATVFRSRTPVFAGARETVLIPSCAVVACLGLVFLLVRRLPNWLLYATPPAVAILICIPPSVSGTSATAGQLLLVWPMLFAAYLLPERVIWTTLVVSLAAFAVVVGRVRSGADVGLWIVMASALLLSTLIVVALRRRVDRLAGALREQATRDALTGLANRRAFDEFLERAVSSRARENRPLSLLTLDVDHFKSVNDGSGHQAGDAVLRSLADVLTARLRVGEMVARIGGEEFAVVLPKCPPHVGRARAEELRRAVATSSRDWPHPITVSVGVATLPDHAGSGPTLQAASDAALYAAKAAGRDSVALSDASSAS